MAKGITKEKIIKEAESLIVENGLSDFSLHILAGRLGIKTASLYTHISGIDEVLTAASAEILQEFHDRQMSAMEGKSRKEALLALAISEREYAKENPAYYELIMNLQLSDNEDLKNAASCIVEPIMSVLAGYKLTTEMRTHAQRTFRACVFGFISQEKHGYFSHFPESIDDSFRLAIRMIATGIEAAEHGEWCSGLRMGRK